MSKLIRMLTALVLSVFMGVGLVGCGDEMDIEIYMPDGAPALAMAKLMHDDNEFGVDVDYNVVSSNNISNYIIQKRADIAILPINAASKILKDGKEYKVLATVTNGNLYIVGNKDISSLNDLKNEVVGIFGAGNVPTLTLKYLLSSNNIEYAPTENEQKIEGKVALQDYVEASYLIPALNKGDISFGLLPEPAVSKLLKMASNFNIELNIQELWEGGSYPQAVMVAKTKLIENNKKLLDDILDAMVENEEWVINNTSSAVRAIKDNLEDGVVTSLQSDISSTAIANCNIKIRLTTDSNEINRMKSYLEKIRSVNSSAIGNYTDNLFYTI